MADEPTTAAPVQPGPWEQDIRSTFANPEEAARVDAFLRARVQPRVTQLEQEIASGKEARELVEAFQTDPVGTFEAVRLELVQAGYRELEASQVANNLAASAAQQPPVQPPTPTPAQTAAAQTEDPRLAEMYAEWTQQKELAAYDAQMEALVNDPANADVDPNLLHPYVAVSGGDWDSAVTMYRAHTDAILQRFGVDPATATAQQAQQAAEIAAGEQTNGAPPVVGAGAGGAGAPVPTTPDYAANGLSPQQALHKAIEDAAHGTFPNGDAPPIS